MSFITWFLNMYSGGWMVQLRENLSVLGLSEDPENVSKSAERGRLLE